MIKINRTLAQPSKKLTGLNKFIISSFVLFLLLSSVMLANVIGSTAMAIKSRSQPSRSNSEPSRATFSIISLETYNNNEKTTKFFSGQTITIRCKVFHDSGPSNIFGANVTIGNNQQSIILLQDKSMTNLIVGSDHIWFIYNHTLSIPTPFLGYTIRVLARATGGQESSLVLKINVVNSPPAITGSINTIYKQEDSPAWVLDLTNYKSDVESFKSELSWHVENVNGSLLNIEIDDNNLTFDLVSNAYGSNEIKLILHDNDQGSSYITFLIVIESVNDLPVITRIPDQVEDEDSLSWFISLTDNIYDVEDSKNNTLLTWSVENVNESLIDIEVVTEPTENILKFRPVSDGYGSNLITLRALDSDGGEAVQQLWVNLTSEDDPPVWKTIPRLDIVTAKNVAIISLLDYITDIDTPDTELQFWVTSTPTSKFIYSTVDSQKRLNITINDPDYIGPGQIKVTAFDGTSQVPITIDLRIILSNFEVKLLAPAHDSKVTTTLPKIYWTVDNPSELDPILFDVYLDVDEDAVRNYYEIALVERDLIDTSFLNYYVLQDKTRYFWSVIPKYYDEYDEVYYGQQEEELRSFFVDLNADDQPPFTIQLSPTPKEVLSSKTVAFKWFGFDPMFDPKFDFDDEWKINYNLYLSTDKDAVSNHENDAKIVLEVKTDNFFVITDLNDDEIYYWTVIPTAKGRTGKCLTQVSSFAINLYNTAPKTVILLPINNSIVQKSPILYWDYMDPDPFEELYFDVYLSPDKSRVESFDSQTWIATVKQITSYYLPDLTTSIGTDTIFYWTVVPNDNHGSGICDCGVWSFTINESIINHPPTTKLVSPKEDLVITVDFIDLVWNGSDIDGDDLTYTVYFSDNEDFVKNLDPSSKLITTTKTKYTVTGLTDGKQYYWTVIPDDGKIYGVCLDSERDFIFDTKFDPEGDEEEKSDRFLQYIQMVIIIFIILILLISIWAVRKHRSESKLEEYLKKDSDAEIPDYLKAKLFTTSTLRSLHSSEGNEESNYDPSGASSSQFPIHNGKGRYAEHVKHAIPYAAGSKKQTHVSTNHEMELAKPLSKKVITDKPFKVSNLPVTPQCTRCGSFKVKTYKDNTCKCLDCRNKFEIRDAED